MKKKLSFLMAAFALFVPSVMAASAPTYDLEIDYGSGNKGVQFFANGTPITIEARTDGAAGALIKWADGELKVNEYSSVFGGSHGSDTKLDTTSITMNGGTLKNVFGGGLHKSHVGTANITINGGKVTGGVNGGGASSYKKTSCHRPWVENTVTTMSKDKATTIVDNAIVTINDGTFGVVYGGGEGMSYTKKSTLEINDGTIDYLVTGGSNGYTDEVEAEVNGGTISVMQSVNRGEMGSSKTIINGGSIEDLYVGGETDASVTGKIDNASVEVRAGEVTNLNAGYNRGNRATANDNFSIAYNENAVENVETDAFSSNNITELVTLTFVAEDFSESTPVPKGTAFTEEEIEALISDLEDALDGSGYKFVGFYGDNKFTTEFDLTKPINEDTTVYLKLEEIKEAAKEENPDTSDMNLTLILSLIALGGVGTLVSYKKRTAKVNN